LGQHRLGGIIPLKTIFKGSLKTGALVRRLREGSTPVSPH
jgi:hypothetical protein